MDKKNLFTSTMLLIALFILFLGCKSPTETNNVLENEPNPPTNRFPEVFLETGNDSNYSYISLRTIRQRDSILIIHATGWGIEEYGLYLEHSIKDSILTLNIMGMCGTVFTYTWVKKTFNYILKRDTEDRLRRICFYKKSDSLTVLKR